MKKLKQGLVSENSFPFLMHFVCFQAGFPSIQTLLWKKHHLFLHRRKHQTDLHYHSISSYFEWIHCELIQQEEICPDKEKTLQVNLTILFLPLQMKFFFLFSHEIYLNTFTGMDAVFFVVWLVFFVLQELPYDFTSNQTVDARLFNFFWSSHRDTQNRKNILCNLQNFASQPEETYWSMLLKNINKISTWFWSRDLSHMRWTW